ncbi:MAG: hypothetical protein P9L92_12315 [Candidatus Electryonea clarkiae]|nr:hypothetical protein [Candidatus Electryonea clarkiae]MDP8286522.1 hypothetical protein [Candidatus Electryonea clarkiae]
MSTTKYYYIAVNPDGRSAAGGETHTKEWLSFEDNGKIEGKGDGNSIDIQFGHGLEADQTIEWSAAQALASGGTEFLKDDLETSQDDGKFEFEKNGAKSAVVPVKCTCAAGKANFLSIQSDDDWNTWWERGDTSNLTCDNAPVADW